MKTLLFATCLACFSGLEFADAEETAVRESKEARVPDTIMAAARKWVSGAYPDIAMAHWQPKVEFVPAKDSFYGRSYWNFTFDGPPPKHSPFDGLFDFKIEYLPGKPISYILSLDENGKRLGFTEFQQ